LNPSKNDLGKVYQADQNLQTEKRRLNNFLERNYPKLVNELKAKLFKDKIDLTRKIREMRTGGEEVVKLNNEIKTLNDEINLKRLELVEEEDKRMRNEQVLKSFMLTMAVDMNQNMYSTSQKMNFSVPVNEFSQQQSQAILTNPIKNLSTVEEQNFVTMDTNASAKRSIPKSSQDFNSAKFQNLNMLSPQNAIASSISTFKTNPDVKLSNSLTSKDNQRDNFYNPSLITNNPIDTDFSASGSYDNINDLNFMKDRKQNPVANKASNQPQAKPASSNKPFTQGAAEPQISLPFGQAGGTFAFKPPSSSTQKTQGQNKPPQKFNNPNDVLFSSDDFAKTEY